MLGKNCKCCNRAAHPYVTAYEIAVKHGFNGTEQEWINSIGTVWIVRALTQTTNAWTCDTTFAEIKDLVGDREIHLMDTEGRLALLDELTDEEAVFCTAPYRYNNKNYYNRFVLSSDNSGSWYAFQVNRPEDGSVTKQMLDVTVQASLDKADTALQEHQSLDGVVPRNQQLTRTEEMTSRIGIDADGKLYTYPAKNAVMITCEQNGENIVASMDATTLYSLLQLWQEADIFMIDIAGRRCLLIDPPATSGASANFATLDGARNTIVYTLNNYAIVTSKTIASSRRIIMTESSGTFTISSTDFDDDVTVGEILDMAVSGVIIQLMNSTTGNAYRLCHVENVGGSDILGFEGVTFTDNALYLDLYVIDSNFDVTRIMHKTLS